MYAPPIFSFWFMIAAYVIHVIDESVLSGSFVEKVQQHWWPQYSWTKFFWFNTGYFVIMIASVLAYDWMGGAWVILPLAWSMERVFNFREYSPGLVSSILIWMNFYFIVRYRPPDQPLTMHEVAPAFAIGLAAALVLFFFIPVVKGRAMRLNP